MSGRSSPDDESASVNCRFEGSRAEYAARGKQVFPRAGERGRMHPKMGCVSENCLRGLADLTEAAGALGGACAIPGAVRAQGK
jgi:hypothetical protein